MRDEVIKAISVYDPAIDTEATDFRAVADYLRERKDWGAIKMLPTKRPVVYHLREIPVDLWFGYVRTAPTQPAECLRAFQAAVVLVENLPSRDGTTIERYEPVGMQESHRIIAEQDLRRFPRIVIEEIGKVASDHSFLAGTIGGFYQLPPSLVELLVRRPFRHADASPTEPASSNDEASRDSVQALKQQLTATTHTDSGGDCGSPTAATAAE